MLEIAVFTTRRWSEEQAQRYITSLEDACEQLLIDRRFVRSCDQVKPGLKRVEHMSHAIFFSEEPWGILVRRVLHQRMLPRRDRF